MNIQKFSKAFDFFVLTTKFIRHIYIVIIYIL